jgi:hypothetical protein
VEILTFDQVLARADVMIGHLAATLDAVGDETGPDDEEEVDFGESPSFADVDDIPF